MFYIEEEVEVGTRVGRLEAVDEDLIQGEEVHLVIVSDQPGMGLKELVTLYITV